MRAKKKVICTSDGHKLYGFILKHFRLSGPPVTFRQFRSLALRHVGSQSIFGSAFFGQTLFFWNSNIERINNQGYAHRWIAEGTYLNLALTCNSIETWTTMNSWFLYAGPIWTFDLLETVSRDSRWLQLLYYFRMSIFSTENIRVLSSTLRLFRFSFQDVAREQM